MDIAIRPGLQTCSVGKDAVLVSGCFPRHPTGPGRNGAALTPRMDCMSIATRLVLALVLTTALVMLPYGAITQRQREHVLGNSHREQTGVMARLLQDAVRDEVRSGRTVDASRVLTRAAANPDFVMAALLAPGGRVLAGVPGQQLGCVRAAARASGAASGRASCGGRLSWAAVPVQPGPATLLIARRPVALQRDLMASRLRHLALGVALIAAAATAAAVVLRRSLGAPLERLAVAVRALEEGKQVHVEIPGELAGLAGSFNQMTARLEERRRRMEHEADERVELERRMRSSEKLAVVGRLSGGLAHELGSPLNVIAFRADAILADGGTSESSRAHAAEVLSEVERIAGLVQGLLHAGRRAGVKRAPVEAAALARHVAEELAGRARAAGVEIRVAAPDPVVLPGDAVLLRHVLFNLARNAVDALEGHPGERWVELCVAEREGMAEMAVEDSGPGLPAPVRAHLFEPFFTTKEPGQGTGLGLAVSRGIVEEHGGELVLEDRPGGGVRAVARIPAGAAVPA